MKKKYHTHHYSVKGICKVCGKVDDYTDVICIKSSEEGGSYYGMKRDKSKE